MPDILLSGHHKNIEEWRRKESIKRTYIKRPDLIKTALLNENDIEILKEIKNKKEKG